MIHIFHNEAKLSKIFTLDRFMLYSLDKVVVK